MLIIFMNMSPLGVSILWLLILRVTWQVIGCQIKYCSVCLWGCFQMRLVFEFSDSVKWIALLGVSGHHQMHWRPEQKKDGERRNSHLFFYLTIWTRAFISFSPVLGLAFMPSALLMAYQLSTPLVLKPLDSEWIRPLVFPGLQLTDGR